MARSYEEALEQLRKTLELDSTFGLAHLNIAQVYQAMGAYPQAIAALEKARVVSGETPTVIAWLASAHARSGHLDEARVLLLRLKALRERTHVSPFDLALVHASLGQRDEAFALLDEAYDEGTNRLAFVNVEPALDSLRDDERFPKLLHRMGLGNQRSTRTGGVR